MSWDGKGSTRAWRIKRMQILERDQHECQVKGPRCTFRATHVHHRLGRGVSENDEHLEAACETCNYAIGDPTTKGDPDPVTRTQW